MEFLGHQVLAKCVFQHPLSVKVLYGLCIVKQMRKKFWSVTLAMLK